jgi:hypothetical protein
MLLLRCPQNARFLNDHHELRYEERALGGLLPAMTQLPARWSPLGLLGHGWDERGVKNALVAREQRHPQDLGRGHQNPVGGIAMEPRG